MLSGSNTLDVTDLSSQEVLYTFMFAFNLSVLNPYPISALNTFSFIASLFNSTDSLSMKTLPSKNGAFEKYPTFAKILFSSSKLQFAPVLALYPKKFAFSESLPFGFFASSKKLDLLYSVFEIAVDKNTDKSFTLYSN